MEENEINQSEKFAELEDKYLRLYAEFENYKKRVQKEKEEIQKNTMINMISSILDVDNDISIAINKFDSSDPKEGLQLIVKKIKNFLIQYGIESIQTDTYDKDLHEVVSMVGKGDKIIEVISKGYTLKGNPFKYPKVILGENER
jgi:molecular chaperone GrpE